MERQDFRDLMAVRAVWPTADFVDPYTIFNIKGNHYRLLTIIHYRYKRVYIQDFSPMQPMSAGPGPIGKDSYHDHAQPIHAQP